MGKAQAYACDGPGCTELTQREAGERGFPSAWLRVTLQKAGIDAEKASAAFHGSECLQLWIVQQLGGESLTGTTGRGNAVTV